MLQRTTLRQKILYYSLLVLLAVAIVFPIYYMIIISLKLPKDIYRTPSLLPINATLKNYSDLFGKEEFFLNIRESELAGRKSFEARAQCRIEPRALLAHARDQVAIEDRPDHGVTGGGRQRMGVIGVPVPVLDPEFDDRLAAAGYRKVEGGGADFGVAAHLRSRQRVAVRDSGYAGPYYGYGYGHWVERRVDVYEYEEGSIILDVVDTNSNKLVWRGVATAAVPEHPKPEERTKLVIEAVEKLLAKFPPPR